MIVKGLIAMHKQQVKD